MLSKDLFLILKFVDQLNKLDTKKTEPLSSVLDKTLSFRIDKVDDGKIKDKILKNSPEKNEDFFYCSESDRVNMSDLNNISLKEIVNLIKSKKISSLEVTKHFVNNIKKGKKLNSFITTCFDESLKNAKNFDQKKSFDGLLSGVPLAVKDLFCTKKYKNNSWK